MIDDVREDVRDDVREDDKEEVKVVEADDVRDDLVSLPMFLTWWWRCS